MNEPIRSVEIDRIRLTGLELRPERAERIQTLVEVELQRLLERDGVADGLVGGDVPSLHVPAMHLADPHSDRRVAGSLAHHVALALRDIGDRK